MSKMKSENALERLYWMHFKFLLLINAPLSWHCACTAPQTELARLARKLPVELRLRIFGSTMELLQRGKRMYDFDQDNITDKRDGCRSGTQYRFVVGGVEWHIY